MAPMGWMGWSVIDDAELARLRALEAEHRAREAEPDDTRPMGVSLSRKFANVHVERLMRDERLVRRGLRALWRLLEADRQRLGLSLPDYRDLCALAGVSPKE